MQYYVKSIEPLLKSKYDSFTQVEKNIADYFINNQEQEDFSSREVAKRLFVSEASLSRFAKKCGFRGFREFIYQYEETLQERKEPVTTRTRTILDIYQKLLSDAYNLLDEVQIRRIVKTMNEVDRVIVCGKGSSGLAASEMESRFMRIGVNIDSIQDIDRMLMQAVFLNKNNLVFGLSISGDTKEVLYLLKESRKKGSRTVLITANNRKSLSDFCEEVVIVPSLKYLNQGNLISPQFPLLLLIDMIYFYYVNQDKAGKELLHDHTLQALNCGDISTYIPF